MGATTWSYPDPAVSTEELLRIVAALRQGFREAYSAYLTKTETFSRHPEIGAKWPQDGYFLPSVEVFMAELDHRSSPQTLSAVLVEAVPRGPSGGETPERNRGVFEP
ncbi:MAG TPA: hypothetical protein VEB01_12910 [Methylocaldum sp.]|nr:hypothetical protein [Methylocaldum sp.]HYE36300.1 hypothetical protein [Methylocaldum sp.]